jgi:Ran GTPase-activating protein (RanGAP) involved in mRNA processing and transport
LLLLLLLLLYFTRNMPPKKQGGGKAGPELPEGEDPVLLLSNYQKYTKAIGIPSNPGVGRALTPPEDEPDKVIDQILIDDDYGPLGPGGTRALMSAVMGTGPGMKGGPYKKLKSIRLWRCHCSDDGAAAIAEVLRLGGAEVAISYLELLDNNIGARGCNALGQALSSSHNVSLLTLKLDYNVQMGTDGCEMLSRGLRTNMALKQLHLQFCSLNTDAGKPLADILANTRSNLDTLNIAGNRLGGSGLLSLCQGLMVNTKLETLVLADNMIDHEAEDLIGLRAFRDCLLTPTVALSSVDLMYNRIGSPGAEILIEATTPESKIKEFLVDLTLPMDLFEKLFKKAGGKKGGKKGKGKKGKKK